MSPGSSSEGRDKKEVVKFSTAATSTEKAFHIYGDLIIQSDKIEIGKGNQSEIKLLR